MNSLQRILIIDDNCAIHDDFRKIFCPESVSLTPNDEADFFGEALASAFPARFELEFARQGSEGCEMLERAVAASRPPSVAFVDVRMPPGIDGIETAARLWQIFPELQIVICTAYSDYSWEEMVARLPQRDRLLILKKPFAAIEALQLASALQEKSALAQRAREHLAETERLVEERTRELRAANERIAAEMAQRVEAERHLLRAQRLESIGTLATGVAHNFNNMLSPIALAAQLLRDEWPKTTREQLLDTIEKSAERAAGVVREVLTFARGTEEERAPLQAGELVDGIHRILRDTFPRNIRIEANLQGNLWLVHGDATQLHQVLINLCVNARDAMPDGGDLHISLENCEAASSRGSSVAGAREGRYVMLRVADTGVGIPPQMIDQIFDPFFTTKEYGKGTGLGLSTVVGIVKSHDGFIDVSSTPGAGTVFEIYLPALLSAAPERVRPILAAPARGSGETVLIVDDEEDILLLLEAVLASRGYRVLTANDGTAALRVFLENQHEIKTVVTDMMMPLVDGLALCRALRGISPNINIIATSGAMDDSRMLELRALNVRNVLSKPFETNALLSVLREGMEGASLPADARELSAA